MTSRTQWMLATLGPTTGLRSVAALTRPEYEEILEAHQSVVEIYSHHRFTLLTTNQKQLTGMRDYASVLLITRTANGHDESIRASLAVATALVNWATAFRLYIDVAKTDLARRFGRKSVQRSAFVTEFDQLLADSDELRLCWEFRNYIQHCDLPLPSLSSGIEPPDDESWARVQFDRDRLLSKYGWREARSVLDGMPDHFDIVPVVDEAMVQLLSLERLLFTFDVDHAATSADVLQEALARFDPNDPPDAQPHLLEVTDSGDGTRPTLRLAHLESEIVTKLVDVQRGAIDAGDLYRVEVTSDHPMSDDGFRDVFNPDNRGIQMLLGWISSGGHAGGYVDTANEIIQADGRVDDLLGDSLMLSYLLLGMTAHSVGDTPEGLLTYLSGAAIRPFREHGKATPRTQHGEEQVAED